MMTKRDRTFYTAFCSMRGLYEDWKDDSQMICRRTITRFFYEAVANISTGYVSVAAKNAKSNERTQDHFAGPQWIGRFIMDNGHIYLEDFTKFKKIAEFASQTITVTKKENTILRDQTSVISDIDGVSVFIETPMLEKYKEAGIVLTHKEFEKQPAHKWDFPLEVPQELLDYESKFLR